MACFLVPAAEAVITTAVTKVVESKEGKEIIASDGQKSVMHDKAEIPLSRKLKLLNTMLWGGSGLLAFEHIWHGEVVPWFPFLTAASNPGDAAEMLHEMSTVGVTMALLVSFVWVGMVIVSNMIEKRPLQTKNDDKGVVE